MHELLQRVEELTISHNQLVEFVDVIKRLDLVNVAMETRILSESQLEYLAEKGVISMNEFIKLTTRKQLQGQGLSDKDDQVVALGDAMLVRFEVFDGPKVVEVQQGPGLLYDVGSGHLGPIDDALVGMRPGEVRTVTTIFDRHKDPSLVGRELTIRIVCDGVKVRARPAAG